MTTDAVFEAVPGGLEVILAVHGADQVHTWTEPDTDVNYFRSWMAQVECAAGRTQIGDMLRRTLKCERARMFIYIGDHMEENAAELVNLARKLGEKQTRVVVLHERQPSDTYAAKAGLTFDAMAKASGGVVLPFDMAAPQRIREMLEALAVVAASGTEGLRARRQEIKAAEELLRLLPPDRPAVGNSRTSPRHPPGGFFTKFRDKVLT